ncbi:OmpA family protein [bacterium]|nr:OmpA family protein [bacterium]
MRNTLRTLVCVAFFTIAGRLLADDPAPANKPIEVSAEVQGEKQVWAAGSQSRSEHLYPSLWGQVGIFRVRSGYSLPQGALTFGIGGEFYSLGATNFGALGVQTATTIAESLFVGYAPIDHLTISLIRRNSSTTYGPAGGAQQLVSSLGDFTLGTQYEFIINPSLSVAPVVNFGIASGFNSLAPGSTLSAGLGAAATLSLYSATQLPLFLHAHLLYHSPQMVSSGANDELFFNVTRFHSLGVGLGAEFHWGDVIPFVEYTNTMPFGGNVGYFNAPSKISVGARFTPLSNKSLAILAGMDIGMGRQIASGVPYTAPVQAIAQLSYTTGLVSEERKHYVTTEDVNVVNRRFVIRRNINFKIGSAILESSSTSLLDQIATVIQKNEVHKLLIVGHTDSSKGDDYNMKLSLDRANAVKAYLVGKGIAEETLMTQGYGKRKPRASNATEEGRAQNRRVEFIIVD